MYTRNMDIKGDSGEFSDRQYVIRKWRVGSPSVKVAKKLHKPFSNVLWRLELESDEIGYVSEDIFKQSVEEQLDSSSAYSKI